MHTQESVCKRKRVGKSEREGGEGHTKRMERGGEGVRKQPERERTYMHAYIHPHKHSCIGICELK